MYTCNSMAMISEIMGFTPLSSSTNLASSQDKLKECKNIGSEMIHIIDNNILPRDYALKKDLAMKYLSGFYNLNRSLNFILVDQFDQIFQGR